MNNRNKSVLITLIIILVFVIATVVVVLVSGGDDKGKNNTNSVEEKESYVDMTADLQEVIKEKLESLYYLVDEFGTTDDFDNLLTNQQKLKVALGYAEEQVPATEALKNLQKSFGEEMTLINENLLCDVNVNHIHYIYDPETDSYANAVLPQNLYDGHGVSFGMNSYSIESIIYGTKSKEYEVKALVLYAPDCQNSCEAVTQYYKDVTLTLPIGSENASADSIFISKKSELEPITFTFKEVNGSYALVAVEI